MDLVCRLFGYDVGLNVFGTSYDPQRKHDAVFPFSNRNSVLLPNHKKGCDDRTLVYITANIRRCKFKDQPSPKSKREENLLNWIEVEMRG